MEFADVIRDRYSCKKFGDKAISKEELDAILEAGRIAPTAKNLQEQRVYVLESDEALARFDEICPCRYGAPTVLPGVNEIVHIFCTSEDINNLAYALTVRAAVKEIWLPAGASWPT